MSHITRHTDYLQALAAIKQRIQTSQTRAVLAVNAELLGLYWDIGRQLDAWQRERAWGSAVVEQMARDLQASYPGMKGFSRTSLFTMRQFYAFFTPQFEVVPQPVGQMPWGHPQADGRELVHHQRHPSVGSIPVADRARDRERTGRADPRR
jgi:hypothetical protein